ncbi:MAG: extracellular solute-binding protein [Ilumatobacteraceae bacterium]|jgi:spermidine/putrescine transport system substrate-binding protein
MNDISRRQLLAQLGAAAGVAALVQSSSRLARASTPPTLAASVTGTLNLLNFSGWAGPTTYADFATAFPGASVNEIAWTSNDDTVAKAKDRSGDIDVVLVDGTTFPRLTALNVMAPIGTLPNLANVSAQYLGNGWDPTNTYFAPTDHGRTGILYRTDQVTTPPASWREFFDTAKEHAGKVVVLDYIRSVMGTTLLMLGKDPSSIEQADLDAAVAELKSLKPSLLAISGEVGKTVVSGDAVLAMCDAYDAASAMAADPKVAWVDPSEGQVGYLEGFVVLDGPRNDLARAFVNFFEEQAQYAAFINAVSSPYVQADNTAISQALRDNPVINPPAAVVDKVVYHQFLGEAQAAWDTAWDAFKSA